MRGSFIDGDGNVVLEESNRKCEAGDAATNNGDIEGLRSGHDD